MSNSLCWWKQCPVGAGQGLFDGIKSWMVFEFRVSLEHSLVVRLNSSSYSQCFTDFTECVDFVMYKDSFC